jgi:transposase
MDQPTMPMEIPAALPSDVAARTRPDQARVRRPVRNQVEWMERDLDSLLSDDHPVRAVWQVLEKLDLAEFYSQIKATTTRPGHPAIDPAILLALWVFATAQGIGSARQLAELCRRHDAYRWLCGGVRVNYHTLSDFRTAHPTELDRILSQMLTILLHADLVTLDVVAKDGTRVRASAGSGSFRRRQTIKDCQAQADAQVARVRHERDHGTSGSSVRQEKARERARRERTDRIEEALRQLPQVEASKDRQMRMQSYARRATLQEARVSTTDPDARVMKMSDGGFRPAYNVEIATDLDSGIIVGVTVVNQGTDTGQAEPMVKQIVERTQRLPRDYLIDGGLAQLDTITRLTQSGLTVYAPTREPRSDTNGRTIATPRRGDSPAVKDWRERMATAGGQQFYRLRAATAEWANAQLKQHGPRWLAVRGLEKVQSLMLLTVITHNVLRWVALTT